MEISSPATESDPVHQVSVVIPVYQGARTLGDLMTQIAPLTEPTATADGHRFRVIEVLLVHDHGPDDSARVMRELAVEHEWIRPVWLSRNYGQHPATLAGMASTHGEWIVTLDEDGQHDPSAIGSFIDVAVRDRAAIVYAKPLNPPPHGAFRNLLSKGAKWVFSTFLTGGAAGTFQSYRLILGEVGRSVAAYAGSGVYLDVALGWVAGEPSACPVTLRTEGDRPSGYNLRRLLSHFWRLVLSSGTRGLRIVSALGVLFATLGVLYAAYIALLAVMGQDTPEGWTSLVVVILLTTGAILFSLGVIAEYIGVAVNMAMGKPPYLIVGDPANGPLERDRR